jgi:hypothetical protein
VSELILSTRALNRALLARQLLLERSQLPLTDALERVAGLQAQYAPSAYIGLWSRLADFRRAALTEAMEQRRAVQATLMRWTIHVVSAGDYSLFAAGTSRARREAWLRFQRKQLDGIDMDAVIERVQAHLAAGPRRHADMLRLVGADGYPRIAWVSATQVIDMVRVPPSGTWNQRRADLYGLADQWLESSGASETEGLEHVVRRYLGAFGPAQLADVASWAGLPVTTLRPVLDQVELRRLRDDEGRELLDVPGSPLPDPDTPAPVRFLPTWDATLLVHARRTQVLPERYRARVFNTKTPHSVPTFLVDGAVAGTWRYEKGRVTVEPFEPLPPSVQDEVEAEAVRLAAFHAD